jgi:hypothetical protein
LKALVGVMGVLIILGTALVIGVIIQRIYAKPAAPSMPIAGAPVKLAPGEHVAGIAGAGGAIAVWVTGPAGDRILLIDPATGGLSVVLAPVK